MGGSNLWHDSGIQEAVEISNSSFFSIEVYY